jgi:hypothetical protein
MRRERSELESAVTTTPKVTITAPTRRELRMSLGTLAIGIAAGPLDRE